MQRQRLVQHRTPIGQMSTGFEFWGREASMLTEDQINNIRAGKGEFHATVQITRKATGKVETYQIVGRAPQPPKEHGSSGSMIGEPAKLTSS